MNLQTYDYWLSALAGTIGAFFFLRRLVHTPKELLAKRRWLVVAVVSTIIGTILTLLMMAALARHMFETQT